MVLNKSSRYEVVRVQTVWTLRRRISCATACNRIATLRIAQSRYLLRHHASVFMSLIRWVNVWTVLMEETRMDLSVPRQRFEHVIQVS